MKLVGEGLVQGDVRVHVPRTLVDVPLNLRKNGTEVVRVRDDKPPEPFGLSLEELVLRVRVIESKRRRPLPDMVDRLDTQLHLEDPVPEEIDGRGVDLGGRQVSALPNPSLQAVELQGNIRDLDADRHGDRR